MLATSITEEGPKTAAEFTQIYNSWFHELNSIEENLLVKAQQIQVLQNSLDSEADKMKHLNTDLIDTQLEQNYVEDMLNALIKEQEELEREISKLEESTGEPSDADSANYEECWTLSETLDDQLKLLKERVKDLVGKVNTKDQIADKESPLPVYRTILDHYTDALELLDSNTTELQKKNNTLQEICLKLYIPTDSKN